MFEETGAGFGNPNSAGPGGNNENSYNNTRKTCREQGLVCFHVRGGNSEHWADIKAFLRGAKMGLTLLEEGPLATHVGGYTKVGRDGVSKVFGYCIFFPRAQIEQMQQAKAGITMSAEMLHSRETWVAKWEAKGVPFTSTSTRTS